MISFCSETSTAYYINKRNLLLKYSGPILKKKTSLETFIGQILEKYPNTERRNISSDIVLENPKFVLTVCRDGNVYDINGFADDFKTVEVLANVGKAIYDSENVDVNVMAFDFYIDDRLGVTFDSNFLIMDSEPSKLYVPYIDTDAMFEQFFKSSENILLLTGESGIGKSKLGALAIEYLSKHTDKITANVASASDVSVLCNEGFWNELSCNEIDLVILDDLDFLLTPRTDEQSPNDVAKNRFISNFLSFTDGFKRNNVKFIITTNQSVDTIDPALLRKGRMFDILELRELTNKEAKVIWNEFIKDKPFKIKGSILACDLAHEIEESKHDFKKTKYLKDSSVSKLNKTSKTIGF